MVIYFILNILEKDFEPLSDLLQDLTSTEAISKFLKHKSNPLSCHTFLLPMYPKQCNLGYER